MNQETALTLMKQGHNVFLTGMAGTGKSYLLNKYLLYCKNANTKVAITASTGIAASHLNGRTFHSWSSIGIKNQEELDLKMAYNPYTQDRIRNTDVLIIDEISMLHAYQLDFVNRLCQKIKDEDKPFGGIQVIVCGDFLQLPPVSKNKSAVFAFDGEAWEELNFKICYLTHIYRQDDPLFIDILNSLRQGKFDRSSFHTLKHLVGRKLPIQKVIELYPKNIEVDFINDKMLSALPGETATYKMTSAGEQPIVDMLKRNIITPEVLKLKIGAVVILTKNSPTGEFVNGTFGEVIDLGKYPKVKLLTGSIIAVDKMSWDFTEFNFKKGRWETLASVSQVPLKLAFAITTHKSQGCTLDCARISLSNLFSTNMGYVALSRVRSLSYVTLTSLDMSIYYSSTYLLDKDKYFLEESNKVELAMSEAF